LARQTDKEVELNTVLYHGAEAVRLLAIYLAPFIPSSSNRINSQLGLGAIERSAWRDVGSWGNQKLKEVSAGQILFPRIEPS
jgi:methionyl-tRNA synthetase